MMAGLLYKDFVGIKGKMLIIIFGVLTVIFLALRMIFPGNVDGITAVMAENAPGQMSYMSVGDLRDSFIVLIPLIFIAVCIVLPTKWTMDICKNDEKNKTMQFVQALPLEKNTYIASKYIFIGAAVYVLYSLENILIVMFKSVAGDNASTKLMMAVGSFLTVFAGISMILAAIELPFFITVGVKKGALIKTMLLELIGLFVVAYVFFGDLDIFENFDIMNFVNWCQENVFAMSLISIISIPVVLLIYYLSYRLTVKLSK